MFCHWTILDSVIICISSIQMTLNKVYYWHSKVCFLPLNRQRREKTQFYDKRDDFTFPIANFPFISSNIPASPMELTFHNSNIILGLCPVLWFSGKSVTAYAKAPQTRLHIYIVSRLNSSNSTFVITIWLTLRNIHISSKNESFHLYVDAFSALYHR